METGSGMTIYCLDRRGRALIASEQGLGPGQIRCERCGKTGTDPLFLEHTLAINDFRLNLELAARAQGHRISRWLDARTLQLPFRVNAEAES